ncbi:MAG: DHH family phosphoesterase [Synergistaceae bacterium]|jgi:phosphoglycolate phosphatase|nr:DHH family phosphoesterase [Synergistaceae bacterium]
MRLSDLLSGERIAIQCHDNPDADALASGFGLFRFFESSGVGEVKFFYCGSTIAKPNLTRMTEELRIPVEHAPDMKKWDGLLINVDCQHGAGNATKVEAVRVAVIDHHIQETEPPPLCELRPWLGSCSTLVWHLLCEESYPIDVPLGTALHFGLFSDTNGFSEVRHPLDRDMWDSLEVDTRLLKRLKRSNLSLEDLRVASYALSDLSMDAKRAFVVIPTPPCDPNLLGFISDMSMQVDGVDIAVSYSTAAEGTKFSVRTAIREAKASELAARLSNGIGSGGGHREKAGGYIAATKFHERFGGIAEIDYFRDSIKDYLEGCDVIDCSDMNEDNMKDIDMASMKTYRKLPSRLGFVYCYKLFDGQADLQIRMLEGDMDIAADEETVLMIGIKGEVYPIGLENFIKSYTVAGEAFTPDLLYKPTVLNKNTGVRISLLEFADTCTGFDDSKILARRLKGRMKVFTLWDAENYFKGDPGDWLVARAPGDIYIIASDVFGKLYIRDFTGEDLSLRPDAVVAVKRGIPVSVTFARGPGILDTNEGAVSYLDGDALVTGVKGELWPVARERFFGTYSAHGGTAPGGDGTYIRNATPSLALQIDMPFVVELGNGGSVLRGGRGDWLMQYEPGEYGIVAREIFEETFDATPRDAV